MKHFVRLALAAFIVTVSRVGGNKLISFRKNAQDTNCDLQLYCKS